MNQAGTSTTFVWVERLSIAEDERYRLLRSDRSRVVLRVLAEMDRTFDLRELAAIVAACETEPGDPPTPAVQRVQLSLHHDHLPRLDDYGVITYDSTANRIVPHL